MKMTHAMRSILLGSIHQESYKYEAPIRVGNKSLSESEQSHVAMLAIKKRAKKSAIRIKNALRRDAGYYRCNEFSNDNRFLKFDSFICNKQTAEVK